MARVGRPPLTAEIRARVRRLRSRGLAYAAIAAAAKIAKSSVSRILSGRKPDPPRATIAPAPKLRCENGHAVTSLPCWTCAAMPNRLLLDKLKAAKKRAEALGLAFPKPPRRKRRKRAFESGGQKPNRLASRLSPERQARLEEIRRRKQAEGE